VNGFTLGCQGSAGIYLFEYGLSFDTLCARMSEPIPDIHYRAVTRATLPDLAAFSDCHGKFQYCSCMRWRMRSTKYQQSTKAIRAKTLTTLVTAGSPVGILAYAASEPIGWCSIAPRESFEALERYKALPRVDDAAVWSVVCFYIDSRFRRRRITLGLLNSALDYARSQGAKIVEGYPVDPVARLYIYMGSPDTFRQAGFRDVTPKGQQRRIVRRIFRSEART
jgi:GNAT superfamily N-acetyltransferase